MTELTDKNYNKLIEGVDKIIFIDFYSPTCGPCQQLTKILPSITSYAEEHGGVVYKVNTAENPKISQKFMIRSVPMTCIIDLDKNVKDVEVGLFDKGHYISLLDKHLKKKQGFFSKFFSF